MLLLVLLGSIVLLVVLITWVRLNPLLALLLTALLAGWAAGMPSGKLLQSIQNGIGSTLGSMAMVLALGIMLGSMLAETGAIQAISRRLLGLFGPGKAHWALMLTSFVVGIAMFYNAGFVVLAPLVFALATDSGRPLVGMALAMAAPLSVTHGFLPPHPGATTIAILFGADPGRTLLYGLFAAVPAVLAAGILFPALLKNIVARPSEGLFKNTETTAEAMPPVGKSLLIALLPVLLMGCSALADFSRPAEDSFRQWLDFWGDPAVALLLAVLASLLLLTNNKIAGVKPGRPGFGEVLERSGNAVQAAAMLLLVIAAGGAFKQVLVDSGLGSDLAAKMAVLNWSPLVLAWATATLLRIAVGSATVAGMTAAGIVQPLLVPGVSPELMTLAVGAGSLMCSHVNDTGFWMFKEWFGLSLKDTFRSWTVMETIVGVVGLLAVLLLNTFIHA